jgi:tRNA (cytidine/uridine-2'-O-)-methyltransferase
MVGLHPKCRGVVDGVALGGVVTTLADMLHIVLYQPKIPPNTGNVGRLCAITRSRLHLIHPLGFKISDRNLRRAGMDYWFSLDVYDHRNWDEFKASPVRPKRLWLLTTKGVQSFWDVQYEDGDGLVFGNETEGAPDWLHAEIGDAFRITIPHANAALRSLNLSTAVGIACYEALRQIGLPGFDVSGHQSASQSTGL